MGRPKRLYPLGKYRLRTPKVVDKEKAYPVELEYTWNRQVIRKTTNVFVKVADWNQNGNQGRGEIRASHGKQFIGRGQTGRAASYNQSFLHMNKVPFYGAHKMYTCFR